MWLTCFCQNWTELHAEALELIWQDEGVNIFQFTQSTKIFNARRGTMADEGSSMKDNGKNLKYPFCIEIIYPNFLHNVTSSKCED